jgi:transcriptional regulator with XRE-family HTH domain
MNAQAIASRRADGRITLVKLLAGPGKKREFARKVGCSEPHLSLILKGERGMSLDLAKRISAASGIPIEKLPARAAG